MTKRRISVVLVDLEGVACVFACKFVSLDLTILVSTLERVACKGTHNLLVFDPTGNNRSPGVRFRRVMNDRVNRIMNNYQLVIISNLLIKLRTRYFHPLVLLPTRMQKYVGIRM